MRATQTTILSDIFQVAYRLTPVLFEQQIAWGHQILRSEIPIILKQSGQLVVANLSDGFDRFCKHTIFVSLLDKLVKLLGSVS